MIPTVRGVILASIKAGLMVNVSVSVSQKTTRPPGLGDGFRGRNPRMRGRDDFVARLDAQGTHGDVEGVRAVGAGDAVL